MSLSRQQWVGLEENRQNREKQASGSGFGVDLQGNNRCAHAQTSPIWRALSDVCERMINFMKKKVAVIGYGGMGGWHVEHLRKSDVCELAGVYDIKEERNELARSRGIFAWSDVDTLLSDPSVEIITVAIPNDSHLETVLAALKAGKHVICEKPVAMNVGELEEMIAAARQADRHFTVHQNRRWDVDYLAMKQVAESGEIGEVMQIESRIHGSRGIPSDWRGEKEHGGGMLLDWGVHLIDQVLQIIHSSIKGIYCRFDHITNQEVDDGVQLNLYFENGARAYVEVGTYNFLPLPRFYMRAQKGTALITDWRENCQVAKCKHWHESEVLPVQTAAGLTKTMAPRDSVTLDVYEIPKPNSDVHDFYRNFCRAIDGAEAQTVTHEQMLRVMRVIEAAFASDAAGQLLHVDL